MTFWKYYKDQWKQVPGMYRILCANFSLWALFRFLGAFSMLFNLQALHVMYFYDLKKMLPDARYAKFWNV